jgi:hypothetical protein
LAKKNQTQKRPHEMTHRQLSAHKRQVRRQRIILFGGIGIIAAIIIIIVAGWFQGEYIPMHKTVLRVYNTKFSTAYFIDRLALGILVSSNSNTSIDDITTSVIDEIMQSELRKQAAEKLGVTVSDNEVESMLKEYGFPLNQADKDAAYAQLLPQKMLDEYFDTIVPVSDTQVQIKTIMVEDYATGLTVQEKMLTTDNYTALVDEYGIGYFTTNYKGDFGLHSLAYFQEQSYPAVPVNYAFSENASVGIVSQPLTDNTSSKQVGYWVIKINNRPTETSANVSAIYCTDDATARLVKSELETTDNLTGLSETYNQYSRADGGQLGVINASDNTSGTSTWISQEFYDYVFGEGVTVGEWSSPVRDETNWTKGSYWVVMVADRQENSPLTEEDRSTLKNAAYRQWSSGLMAKAAASLFNNFTDELKAWAVEKAIDKVKSFY